MKQMEMNCVEIPTSSLTGYWKPLRTWDNKTNVMKKALAALIILAVCILVSSCNKHTCPAYSQNDTEQTEPAG